MKFTMDGGLSAYDYKAEEEEAGEDVNFKALAGARSTLCCFPCFLISLNNSSRKSILLGH